LEAGAHDVIRGTWGQALRGKAVLKFFIGRDTPLSRTMLNNDPRNSYSPKSDEVILDCPDDYAGLVFKTRGICGYASNKAVSHIFLVDTDTCVFVKKLLSSGYERLDYAGRWNGEPGAVGAREVRGGPNFSTMMPECYSWCSGGGYLLSLDAAREVADRYPQPMQTGGYGGNEDLWVGQILGPLVAKGNLTAGTFPEPVCKYYVDADGNSNTYDPKSGWMEQTWQENQ
jgi:hypothetical protein